MGNKIMIVDDDPNILELVLEYLADKPDELLYAPNGERAIQLAIEEQPNLILMDWEMPVLNGIEAVKQLKNDSRTDKIPIIIATGVMIKPSNLKEALDTGAVDFLRKPFNPIEFNARVRANLRIVEQHKIITGLLETEKKLIQEALERKERELASTAMFEHEKNNIITKLIEQLDALTTDSSSKISQQLIQIKRQLHSKLNLSKSWNNFKVSFEEVHPDFFNKLDDKYGPLNLNEKRMCSYLKIGLDNKEIAMLTNIEAGSVRKFLNRLKNKLGLTAEDNLREHITQL